MRRSLLWPLLAVAGCNAVLGIGDDPSLSPASASCLRNSDCATDQVCLFEVCSAPCLQDRDCPSEERCLQTDEGSACVKGAVAVCGDDQPCPTGSVCSGETCRNACDSSGDCLEDQTCDPAGVCRGTDPTRDPQVGSGSGGSGGQGGAPSESAGAGGDEPVGGGPSVDDECDDEGAASCAGSVSAARLRCEDGSWMSDEPCADGELCDASTAGQCKLIPTVCEGRAAGESFCVGAVRTRCSDDLLTVEEETCNSVQLCNYGSGADCAACLPNEHHCSGDVLQVCNAESTGFAIVEECTDEPCNADAGACTTLACVTPGELSCREGDLYECAQDQMSWDLVQDCGQGVCDPVDLECDICTADSCADETTRLDCSADGQTEDEVGCGNGTPYCTGSGVCVECTSPAHCAAPNSCYTASCDVNTRECELTFKGTGQSCSGGYCKAESTPGSSTCVECLTQDHCDADTEVCRSSSCANALQSAGWPGATTSASDILEDVLYLKQLPALAHGAELLSFGVVGAEVNGSAKLALYADNGNAASPAPTGGPIATTQSAITLDAGALEMNANPPGAVLTAGAKYWIAVKVSTPAAGHLVSLRSAAGTVVGESLDELYSAAFQTFSGAAISGSYSTQLAIYVKIKETD